MHSSISDRFIDHRSIHLPSFPAHHVPFFRRPLPDLDARNGFKYGNGALVDGLAFDGLTDPYDNQPMGMCAEKCADDFSFTREEQDAYAKQSYERAVEASSSGKFEKEIVSVAVPQRRGDPKMISQDEEPFKLDVAKLPALRPAFKKDGSVTAANASSINDGACALVLMSAKAAKERGCVPLARIRGYGDAAKTPIDFTTAPADAVPIALKRAGMSLGDVEYHEINEAFAVVSLIYGFLDSWIRGFMDLWIHGVPFDGDGKEARRRETTLSAPFFVQLTTTFSNLLHTATLVLH